MQLWHRLRVEQVKQGDRQGRQLIVELSAYNLSWQDCKQVFVVFVEDCKNNPEVQAVQLSTKVLQVAQPVEQSLH